MTEIGRRIKVAKSLHELAAMMYFVRDAGTTVKVFDFPADASFYQELQTGKFKKAKMIAQRRFEAVNKAKGKVVPFEGQLAVRRDYSAALHKFLLTKRMPKATRSLIMKQLAHHLKKTKLVKTPFGSDAVAETPFDEGKKPARMKGSKRR